MAFIHATWAGPVASLHINVDHIVAVIDGNPNCIIQTVAPVNGGSQQYWVKESYADILKRIETAQAYGPK